MPSQVPKTISLNFSVDAALLRELGERLVGSPAIAVAELVKNAYDADATRVTIKVLDDRIEVIDNGHGMTFAQFRDYWMRVGVTHKQDAKFSPTYKRPLTGSKGVGRLAVQFLGRELTLASRTSSRGGATLLAHVDWDDAIRRGDLTEATVRVKTGSAQETPSDLRSSTGTAISITRLTHNWTPDRAKELANQIWMLRPPLGRARNQSELFDIVFESSESILRKHFEVLVNAILTIYHAKITGTLDSSSNGAGSAKVSVQVSFPEWRTEKLDYSLDVGEWPPGCPAELTILVYHLRYRQPHGIRVADARKYLDDFGGIGIYDAGFRLPHYGKDTDWLNLERDHAHRVAKSKLLPESLHSDAAMTFLPNNNRLLGIVQVDTSRTPGLNIAITRDRLLQSPTFQTLRDATRLAIDFYAALESRRQREDASAIVRRVGRPSVAITAVAEALDRHESTLPKVAAKELREAVERASTAASAREDLFRVETGLLGSLAAAGMMSLALHHELNKTVGGLDSIAERMRRMREIDLSTRRVRGLAAELETWSGRARATQRLFSPLLDPQSRTQLERLRIRPFIEELCTRMGPLLGPVRIETEEVPADARFPEGTATEWSSILQNVILNAANAMSDDIKDPIIAFTLERTNNRTILYVSDNGIGVDLGEAASLFEPFVRGKKAQGPSGGSILGGTGLGLTIVKMLAENRGCLVRFENPYAGFSTAFALSWSK